MAEFMLVQGQPERSEVGPDARTRAYLYVRPCNAEEYYQ